MHDPSSQTSHTEYEHESEHTVSSYEHEANTTPQPENTSTASLDPFHSESSFLPAQAISSTPAAKSRSRIERHEQNPHDTFTTQGSDPSWTASLESPMVRLDRDLREFTRAEQMSGSDTMDSSQDYVDNTFDETIHARSSRYTQSQEADINQTPSELRTRSPSPSKGRSRAQSSLRVDVLRSGAATSPLKVRKPKTPVTVSKNPYLPSGTKPRDWSGVVDLRDPNVLTPRRPSARGENILNRKGDMPDDDDDDDWDLPPGMSPPMMMDIARLPQLGRTPGKEAAARIGRDLVDAQGLFNRAQSNSVTDGSSSSYQYNASGWDPARKVESSLSSAPTPPSLSRYTRRAYPESESGSMAADATLESMIRRVGLMGYQQEQPSASGSGSRLGSTASAPGLAPASASGSMASTPRYTEQTFAPASDSIPATSLVTPVPPLQPRHAPTSAAYPPSPPTAPLPASNSPSPIPEADLSVGSIGSASSTDSLDEYEEIHNTAHPSAAFLMASRQRGQNDARLVRELERQRATSGE
ncbi:hypothetical protein EWM64_g1820 [Hericium alpestre]|uniref:Uncharacterized protein n=1 Tax=Hericium alpestre TaxID=135208 RepID=A0A4Z0A5A0_9AGAM|nr:hypothetical protein EWM64_g1820 [Hericium alpestre]